MSFAQPNREHRRGTPMIIPMIDVLFLLLIFLVTTSSFRAEERDVSVNLPVAESATANPSDTPTQIIINVATDGSVVIGNEKYNRDALRQLLTEVIADYPDERVIIRGDRHTDYEHIIAVMDMARASGVRNLFFATVKVASEVGG